MFQVINPSNNSYDIVYGSMWFIIILETMIKLSLNNLNLEFIYNIFNNLILNIILCGCFYLTNLSILIELYTYIFIYTNIYKLLFSNDRLKSLLNIYSIYYFDEYQYIFFLSEFGYIFFYLKDLKKYSNFLEDEYYIFHQLYLFLFRFIPLCYLLSKGKLYCINYLILLSFKILYI